MSRFCWSLVTCGLAVTLAGSFEAVRAKDREPRQPAGGRPAAGAPSGQGAGTPRVPMPPMSQPGQPAKGTLPGQGTVGAGVRVGPGQIPQQGVPKQITPSTSPQDGKPSGTPLQPFQPNTAGKNIQGGKTVGGSSPQGNIGGGAIPGKGTIPQGAVGRPQSGGNPAPGVNLGSNASVAENNFPLPGNTVGTPTTIFDRWGNLKNSVKKPPISVEPRAGQQTLSGTSGSLPGDPKGAVKVNPLPEPTGQSKANPQRNPMLRQIGIGAIQYGDRSAWKPHGMPELGQLGNNQKLKPLPVAKPGKLSTDSADKRTTSQKDDKLPSVNIAAGDVNGDGRTDEKFHSLLQAKNRDDLIRKLHAFKIADNASPLPRDRLELNHPNLNKISGAHQERLANLDNFPHWQQTNVVQKLGLRQQFEFQRQGDLSRRLNLNSNLMNAGGWAQHRQHGVIAAGFTSAAFSGWYAGGGCFPAHAWCPTWSPWVGWSYWDMCPAFYDPRPYFCIPIVYEPCLPWVYYDYPVWLTLPVVSCGTWIDVSPIVVAGQDVQLLAVRFVENGHPEQNLGPRYRVWVRNNSPVQIVTPFSVLMLASNEQTPTVELPQTGVVVTAMDIGETQALDIRLPLAANRLGVTPEGYRVPFTYLHVLVDSHQQIPEMFEDNNGAVLARTDILPVDPAAFSTDLTAAAPESLLTIAGEGFGPEPGQVIVSVYGQQVQAEIHGWYDLGIQFAVPNFTLTQPVDAEVLVVRGDTAVSNPLTVRLAPKALLEEVVVLPASPIPDPLQ